MNAIAGSPIYGIDADLYMQITEATQDCGVLYEGIRDNCLAFRMLHTIKQEEMEYLNMMVARRLHMKFNPSIDAAIESTEGIIISAY